MNRNSFSFFVALLIHLVIFLLFFLAMSYTPKETTVQKKKEKRVKISLKEYKKPKKAKDTGDIKKKIKPSPVAPPLPKGGQLKKLVKKPLAKYKPKKTAKKTPKLNKPKKPTPPKKKTKPQPKQQPLPPQQNKPLIPIAAKQEQNTTKTPPKPKDPLYALLSQDHSAQEETQTKQRTKTLSKGVAQNIKELYGDEFGKLTPGQQQYILDNQEIMRRITQEVLYRVARVNLPRDLSVNATNVIEFKLHPDGSMSDFRFLKKSGVYILDETTKETIEYAYSKYPHPKETTLIRYNVFYNLARY